MKNIFSKYTAYFTFALMFIILSNKAFAADMFAPVQQDLSLNILSQMFGDLVARASPDGVNSYVNKGLWLGTGLDPFQYILLFFNKICLVVAALLAGLSITKGLIDTASEGQFLGKEISNPFYWARTTIFTALILPIWSGYCTLQLVIMWFIIQSVGLADTILKAWYGYQEKSILGGEGWSANSTATNGSVKDLYALKVPSPQSAEVVYKAFEGQVCLYGLASERMRDDIYSDSSIWY